MAKQENSQSSSNADPQHDLDFVLQRAFPDPASVFSLADSRPETMKASAVVVLDTNALMAPYEVGPVSLSTLERVLKQLKSEKRLVVPGQVAREFAKHRAKRLEQIYAQLNTRKSVAFGRDGFPLLEPLAEYKALIGAEKALIEAHKSYSKSLDSVLSKIREWTWNDPVSALYGKIFGADEILDVPVSREIVDEYQSRVRLQIPPGYKDSAKESNGAGDYLIWKSILAIAVQRKLPVLFVTADAKADWWIRAGNQTLYPRFELQDEFRRASGGPGFSIAPLHEFLELFGADTKVVDEVRKGEDASLLNVRDRQQQQAHRMWVEGRILSHLAMMHPGWEVSPCVSGLPDYVAMPKNECAPTVGIELISAVRLASLGFGDFISRMRGWLAGGSIDRMLVIIIDADAAKVASFYNQLVKTWDGAPISVGNAIDIGGDYALHVIGPDVFAR